MAYILNEGEGSMFNGDNPKGPAFRLSLMLNGEVHRWVAWRTVAKSGQEYFQLKPDLGRMRCQTVFVEGNEEPDCPF